MPSLPRNQGPVMNKDQAKGKAKDSVGKLQQAAGKAIGSEEQQAKGLAKQVAGKTQEKVGDAKEAVADKLDKLEKKVKDDEDDD